MHYVALGENTFLNIVALGLEVLNWQTWHDKGYIDGSVQDCSNSSVLAMELLQSCTKPLLYTTMTHHGSVTARC